ncbi:MAG: hypothetical protein JSR17_08600 [Proteobacteria bacterium]|nr:hypothetical protein [Pseudomonadota bacterium]
MKPWRIPNQPNEPKSAPVAITGRRNTGEPANPVRNRLRFIDRHAPDLTEDVLAESALLKERPDIVLAKEAAMVRKEAEQKDKEAQRAAAKEAAAFDEEVAVLEREFWGDEEELAVAQQLSGIDITDESAQQVSIASRPATVTPRYDAMMSQSLPTQLPSQLQSRKLRNK